MSKDQNHGSVWGRFVWRGKEIPFVKRIGPALKREWKIHSFPNYLTFSKPEFDEENMRRHSEAVEKRKTKTKYGLPDMQLSA